MEHVRPHAVMSPRRMEQLAGLRFRRAGTMLIAQGFDPIFEGMRDALEAFAFAFALLFALAVLAAFVEKVLVSEGQSVNRGDSLVKLLDSDIRLTIKALRTDLDLKRAKRLKLISEKIAFETELTSKLETQREKIKTIQMESTSIKGRLKLAKKNIKRVEFLFKRELIPEEKLNLEKDKFLLGEIIFFPFLYLK